MDGGYLTTAIRKAYEFISGRRAKPDLPGVERVLLKQPIRANDVTIDALRGMFGKPNLQVTDEEITDPYWLLKMQNSSRQPGTRRS